MAAKVAGKPKMNAVKASVPGRTNFVLGSRPDALRAPPPAPVQRIKPDMAPDRNYGKPAGPKPITGGFSGV